MARHRAVRVSGMMLFKQRCDARAPYRGNGLARWRRDFFAHQAVPGNYSAIDAFRYHVINGWLHSLRRRSQRCRMPWDRFNEFIDRYISKARVRRPWPEARFRVTHSRWELGALAAPAGICAGATVFTLQTVCRHRVAPLTVHP
jgi:hypothetical protein